MADSEDNENISQILQEIPDEQHVLMSQQDFDDPMMMIERLYLIWWKWADFHLYVTSPILETYNPPRIIEAAMIPGTDEKEFVYTIHDHGHRLSTSKAEDMYSAGMSMCKLHYTIEKMVAMLVDRLKEGGISTDTEVQVAFGGHELAYRKAFEVIINLSYNVVVSNFDPGVWGESFLQNIKRMADQGKGYPPESPRDIYKRTYNQTGTRIRR